MQFCCRDYSMYYWQEFTEFISGQCTFDNDTFARVFFANQLWLNTPLNKKATRKYI